MVILIISFSFLFFPHHFTVAFYSFFGQHVKHTENFFAGNRKYRKEKFFGQKSLSFAYPFTGVYPFTCLYTSTVSIYYTNYKFYERAPWFWLGVTWDRGSEPGRPRSTNSSVLINHGHWITSSGSQIPVVRHVLLGWSFNSSFRLYDFLIIYKLGRLVVRQVLKLDYLQW